MPMLQAVSTDFIIPEPSDDLLANEPWSIEIYADGLMDELFADIDEILDFSGNLPSQSVRYGSRVPRRSHEDTNSHQKFYKSANPSAPIPPEFEPLETVNVPQIVLPNALNRTGQGVSQLRNKQMSTVVVGTPTVPSLGQRYQKTKRALGKLLILGTTIGVAIAGTIYFIHSGMLLLLTSRLTQPIYTPQSQSSAKPDVEAELVDYMLGALTVLDKQDARNNQQSSRIALNNRVASNSNTIAFANTQPAGQLPPPLSANNTPLPLSSNRSSNVVERIYIPVYQAPSPMRYAPPPIPGKPTVVTNQPSVVKTALNQVPQPAKPVNVNMMAAAVRPGMKPVPVQTAPITVRQPSSPLPTLPVVPFGAAPPNLTATATTPEAALVASASQQQAYTPAVATPSHTLEGLLESGSKSLALFKVDGVTRRIKIGEGIGSSGWTLVDISNGEAVVRRNGEVRSIYAGQKL